MTDHSYSEDAAAAIVMRQVDAFNARDLQTFLDTYDDKAVVVGAVADRPLSGRDELSTFYAARFEAATTRCVIASLVQLDERWVVLKEILINSPAQTEAIATFEVNDGKIQRASIIKRSLSPASDLKAGPLA